MAGILFEDIFDVKDIDPEGKKFDRGELEPSCSHPLFPEPLLSFGPPSGPGADVGGGTGVGAAWPNRGRPPRSTQCLACTARASPSRWTSSWTSTSRSTPWTSVRRRDGEQGGGEEGGGRPGLLRAGSAWCWAVPSSQGCVVLALCWG